MGSNLHMPHTFLHFVLSVGWHTALRQRNEDRQCGPLLAPPCAWGLRAGACKRCGGCFGPNFSAPARVPVRSKDGPPAVTRACCLRAASQWRLSIVCIPSKVVSKVLRSSEFGLCQCRGRQAVLTAVICFGPCALEQWGFAYILRSGGSLLSACNLKLPLVAARAAALVSYVPLPRASQDNAIKYEGYERPA